MEITNKLDLFDKLTAFVMTVKNTELSWQEKEELIIYYCDLIGTDRMRFNLLPYVKVDNKIQLVKMLLNDYDERAKK